MNVTPAEIRVKGKTRFVPSACINGRAVLRMGRWIRVAVVADEEWLEGDSVADPVRFAAESRKLLKADLCTFYQKPPDTRPKYDYPLEWDSFAAIPVSTYSNWWEKQVPKEIRQNVKKADRMGIVVKEVPFNDDLVQGIVNIYNETPTRQGRRFWHYGKDFATIKHELSTFLDRTRFIGAYHQDELVGFIKLVQMGKIADIMHILCRTDQNHRKPVNALLAKAVEMCEQHGWSHLLYGRYAYGRKRQSSLTDFKSRNGFVEILVPRYYIPLTAKGRLVLKLKLHHGIRALLPQRLVDFLLRVRAKVYDAYGAVRALSAKWSPVPKREKNHPAS